MTVGQMLRSMDSHEISEWAEFLRLENEDPRRPAEAVPEVEQDLRALFGRGQ